MRGSMAADLRVAKVYEELEPDMFSTQMKGALAGVYPEGLTNSQQMVQIHGPMTL